MRALDDQVRLGKVLYLGVSDTPAWVISQMQTLAADRGWSRSSACRSSTHSYSGRSNGIWYRWPADSGWGFWLRAHSAPASLSGKYASPAASGDARRLADVDPAKLAIA